MQPSSVPPIQYGVGETILGRQTRIRPSATPPVVSDSGVNKCAKCLDHFMHHDKVLRLQCGHIPCTVLGPSGASPCGQAFGWGLGLITAEFTMPSQEIKMQQIVMKKYSEGLTSSGTFAKSSTASR
eukprot:946692-Pyramimonas_sp.AAC.1